MTNETTSKITIRSLTVKEMRELRKAGYDPAFADKDDSAATTTGMVDWILEHVYGDQITDDKINLRKDHRIKAGASVIDGKALMTVGYEQGRFEALAHFDGGRYKGATVMYNIAEW